MGTFSRVEIEEQLAQIDERLLEIEDEIMGLENERYALQDECWEFEKLLESFIKSPEQDSTEIQPKDIKHPNQLKFDL